MNDPKYLAYSVSNEDFKKKFVEDLSYAVQVALSNAGHDIRTNMASIGLDQIPGIRIDTQHATDAQVHDYLADIFNNDEIPYFLASLDAAVSDISNDFSSRYIPQIKQIATEKGVPNASVTGSTVNGMTWAEVIDATFGLDEYSTTRKMKNNNSTTQMGLGISDNWTAEFFSRPLLVIAAFILAAHFLIKN